MNKMIDNVAAIATDPLTLIGAGASLLVSVPITAAITKRAAEKSTLKKVVALAHENERCEKKHHHRSHNHHHHHR